MNRKYGPLHPGDVMVPPAYAARTAAEAARDELAASLVALDRTDEAGVYINKIDRVWYGIYVHRYAQQEAS